MKTSSSLQIIQSPWICISKDADFQEKFSSSLLLCSTSVPGWTLSTLSSHFTTNPSWRAPAQGPMAEAECAAAYIDVDYSRQFSVKIITSKHLPARQEAWKWLKGKLSVFRPLKVYADRTRLFQLLSELVNVPCVWMRPAVFVCVCLVGAERPQ